MMKDFEGGAPPDGPESSHRTKGGRPLQKDWTLLVVIGLLLFGLYSVNKSPSPSDGGQVAFSQQLYQKEILVMYIFAASDPEFYNNLHYFIEKAVSEDSRSDYVIVVQKLNNEVPKKLPTLPRNAKYVFHTNDCYDWGSFGWLLESGHVNIKNYKYFFFMNCTVRGPFLPAYARGRIHWTQPFIKRLVGDVKIVGPTISCEGSPLNGDMKGKWRRNAHVQSYVVATDRVGLQLLVDDGKVFHCHNSRWNTIYFSELGSSDAILSTGYNIDTFMLRYQGINWRDKRYWDCNHRFSPQGDNYLDGTSLDPLELMFVKVKSFTLQNEYSFSKKAIKYQEWDNKGKPMRNLTSIAANDYLSNLLKYKVPKILTTKARGPACFDFDFYGKSNSDLVVLNTTESMWKHFVYFGQFEARQHNFSCPMDWKKYSKFH